jgi:hypothetical protein
MFHYNANEYAAVTSTLAKDKRLAQDLMVKLRSWSKDRRFIKKGKLND